MQRKLDVDGVSYTRQDCVDFYGGVAEWGAAPPVTLGIYIYIYICIYIYIYIYTYIYTSGASFFAVLVYSYDYGMRAFNTTHRVHSNLPSYLQPLS